MYTQFWIALFKMAAGPPTPRPSYCHLAKSQLTLLWLFLLLLLGGAWAAPAAHIVGTVIADGLTALVAQYASGKEVD